MIKKSYVILFVSLIVSFLFCFSAYKEPVQVISSFTVGQKNQIYFLEGFNHIYHLDEEGNIILKKSLKLSDENKGVEYQNLCTDENGNIYILAIRYDKNGIVDKQWVEKISEDGKKTERIFECNVNSERKHIYTIQYVNGHIIAANLVDSDKLLFEMYDTGDGDISAKEYEFKSRPEFTWIKYTETGSIYYLTDDNFIYCLENSTTGEYNKKIDHTKYGFTEMVPQYLTSDEKGTLYFNDVCTPRLMAYYEKYDTMKEIYNIDSSVAHGYTYGQFYNFRCQNGVMTAISNEMELQKNTLFIIDGDNIYAIDEKIMPFNKLAVYFVMSFLLSFIALSIAAEILKRIKQTKSILIKQTSVMAIILLISTIAIAHAMRYYLRENLMNETYLQLYTFARNFENNFNADKLSNLELPLENNDPYYDELREATHISLSGFYDIFPKAIRKEFYYNIYCTKNDKEYLLFSAEEGWNSPFKGIYKKYMDSSGVMEWKNETDSNFKLYLVKADGEGSDSLYCIYSLYDSKGNKAGEVEIGIAYSPFYYELNYTVHKFIYIIIAFMAIILAALTIIVKKTLGSLKKLKQGVSNITDGNWNTLVDINSNDEIEEIGNAFNKMSRRVKNNFDAIEKLNITYEKFVPRDMIGILEKNSIMDVNLGDYVKKKMGVFSVSTRNFYEICENMSAVESFEFFNWLYALLFSSVHKTGGVIEDYQGAGLRALYQGNLDSSIDGALEIIEKVSISKRDIKLNIILQCGIVMFGIVGTESKMEAVASGEALNYTYRLREMAEKNGINILITAKAYESVKNKEKYHCRYIGRIMVNSDDKKCLDVYDVLDAYSLEERENRILTMEMFSKGIDCFIEGKLYEARKNFIDVVRIDKNDKIAESYIFLCDKFIEKLPESWQGYYC